LVIQAICVPQSTEIARKIRRPEEVLRLT
jgi:hypothetical protein